MPYKRTYARKRFWPYKAAKKFSRKVLPKGLSLVEISSRMRSEPPWKKRKYTALSFQNDEDPSVSDNRVQSGTATVAPLSSVRFKPAPSSVFDYHHFVRKVKLNSIYTAIGAAGTVVHNIWAVKFSDILDATELAAVYGRYRITRLVFEWCAGYDGVFPASNSGDFLACPLFYRRIFRSSGVDAADTEAKMLQDPSAESSPASRGWFLSMTPNMVADQSMEQSGGVVVEPVITMAPWIDTDQRNQYHFGIETTIVQRGSAFAATEYLGDLYCQIYFDMDGQGF